MSATRQITSSRNVGIMQCRGLYGVFRYWYVDWRLLFAGSCDQVAFVARLPCGVYWFLRVLFNWTPGAYLPVLHRVGM